MGLGRTLKLKNNRIILTLLLTLSLFVGGCVDGGGQFQNDESNFVYMNTCQRITEPGNYRLTKNLTSREGVCIKIKASNVVIDGQGHIIKNIGEKPVNLWGNSYGVQAENHDSIMIRNIGVENYAYGIYVCNSSNSLIKNNQFVGGNYAIYVAYSSDSQIIKNTISNSYNSGILLLGSSNSEITNNMVNDSHYAIQTTNSSETHIMDNTITWNKDGNTGVGIAIQESSFADSDEIKNTVTGNKANNNHIGIELLDSSNVKIAENTVYENDKGIQIIKSFGNQIKRNTVKNNGGGIEIGWGSNNNDLVNNIVCNNNEHDIILEEGSFGTSGQENTCDTIKSKIENLSCSESCS